MSNSLLKSQQNSRFIVSVILAVFGFIMILPFLWMFLSSFKTNAEIVQNTRSFFLSNGHWKIIVIYFIAALHCILEIH